MLRDDEQRKNDFECHGVRSFELSFNWHHAIYFSGSRMWHFVLAS